MTTTSLVLPEHDLKLVLLFVSLAFLMAVAAAPVLTEFLYKNKIGKQLRQHGTDGKATPIFSALHAHKKGTPVMGGLLFWVTTAFLTVAFNYTRQETLLPVFVLVAAGVIGAVDDLMNAQGIGSNGGGLRMKHKFWIYLAVAIAGAWWFHYKLDWDQLFIPLWGKTISLGLWYLPVFIGTTIFVAFSMNQTDGLDGLAGGVGAVACFFFTFLALLQGKLSLAIFCATLLGSLMAFLWFNINPARFFMGDTGSMALGMVLPILAFITNSVLLLPFVLLIPFLEGISTIVQIISKSLFKRKVFLAAPLHHHFEAMGWPEAKVTMRFWLVASIGAAVGLLLMVASK